MRSEGRECLEGRLAVASEWRTCPKPPTQEIRIHLNILARSMTNNPKKTGLIPLASPQQ